MYIYVVYLRAPMHKGRATPCAPRVQSHIISLGVFWRAIPYCKSALQRVTACCSVSQRVALSPGEQSHIISLCCTVL